MSYLPSSLALAIDETSEPFWVHCSERRLAFRRCIACSLFTHPPLATCPGCRSTGHIWVNAPLEGRVFSVIWVHTAAHPLLKDWLPYNVAVIEFPDMAGVRLVSNVIDGTMADLRIGDFVQLVWEQDSEGWRPRYRKSCVQAGARQ